MRKDGKGLGWRRSAYNVCTLGLNIETVHDPHGGTYPRTHARYVLHTPVKVIGIDDRDGSAS